MGKRRYRIGIVGGMGPMAGVLLQKLIIENTPVTKDQDHIEVVCFTNPHIPDRTKSLREDNGEKYVAAIVDSIRILERAEVDCILIPCNTAHAKFDDIQRTTQIPIVNMIEKTQRNIRALGVHSVGLLATDGTIASGVFTSNDILQVLIPSATEQQELMDLIYGIKAGKDNDRATASKLKRLVESFQKRGAEKVILGCTELSLYAGYFENGVVIDPLRILAEEAVKSANLELGE